MKDERFHGKISGVFVFALVLVFVFVCSFMWVCLCNCTHLAFSRSSSLYPLYHLLYVMVSVPDCAFCTWLYMLVSPNIYIFLYFPILISLFLYISLIEFVLLSFNGAIMDVHLQWNR